MGKFELIEELKNNPQGLSIDEISTILDTNANQAYTTISSINKSRKFIRLDIKIVRTGKHGNSRYHLVKSDTNSDVIIKNMNTHIKRSLNHARRQRELGLVGRKTRPSKKLIKEFGLLVKKITEEYYRTWNGLAYDLDEDVEEKEEEIIAV